MHRFLPRYGWRGQWNFFQRYRTCWRKAHKSANNRAFYSIEKSVKALLAIVSKEVKIHSGSLKQFNFEFIYKGDGTFSQEDYQLVAKAERIRNASDYDDFYIASKEETQQQVANAEYIVGKIEKYIVKEKQP